MALHRPALRFAFQAAVSARQGVLLGGRNQNLTGRGGCIVPHGVFTSGGGQGTRVIRYDRDFLDVPGLSTQGHGRDLPLIPPFAVGIAGARPRAAERDHVDATGGHVPVVMLLSGT